MKNKDTHSLSSLYEQVLTGNKILNENVPPITDTGVPLTPQKAAEIDVSGEHNPATVAIDKYPGQVRMPGEDYRKLVYALGDKILKHLATLPDRTFPGTDVEFYNLVGKMIDDVIPGVYPKSHRMPHQGRQIAHRLLEPTRSSPGIGVIKRVGATSRGGRNKKDVEGLQQQVADKLKSIMIPPVEGGTPKISP